MLKIVFFGTPSFVMPIADSLLKIPNVQLCAVVTNADRPVGRKQILTPSPIKTWATANNISVLTPEKLDSNFLPLISRFHLDLGILAAYGKIIPRELIDLFPKGILVIHPSLLPKYRGASPIQTAILNGDKITGVSIIQMDNKMDHGPILAQFKEEILEDDTSETLTKRLFEKTSTVIPDLIGNPGSSRNSLDPRFRGDDKKVKFFSPPLPQDHTRATFTKLLKKDGGFISWKTLASKGHALRSYNFIRAMTPRPGAWTLIKKKRLKILRAHLENGNLILDVVQLEGKKPIYWKEFSSSRPGLRF